MDIKADDFIQDTKDNLNKIILDDTHPIYYGSVANPNLIFRGDIDLMTILETNNREGILKELKDIIKKHKDTDNGFIFMGEVKFGENEEVRDKIEEITKKRNFNKFDLKKYLSTLEKPDNADKVKQLLNKKINNDTYYELLDELREYYTYRWTPEQILKGEADHILEQNAPVYKMDFQIWTGNRYIETSNFIVFKAKKKPNKKEEKEEFIESLKDNIHRIYYSDKNYYKVLKRLLTYYKQVGDNKMIRELQEIINDPEIGNLYLFMTLLKVHKTIIKEHKNKLDEPKLIKSIDSLKNNTIYLEDEMRNELNKWIDKMKEKKSISNLNKYENMINKLQEIINEITLKVVKKNKLNLIKLINKI